MRHFVCCFFSLSLLILFWIIYFRMRNVYFTYWVLRLLSLKLWRWQWICRWFWSKYAFCVRQSMVFSKIHHRQILWIMIVAPNPIYSTCRRLQWNENYWSKISSSNEIKPPKSEVIQSKCLQWFLPKYEALKFCV